jgi:hypothetical protein
MAAKSPSNRRSPANKNTTKASSQQHDTSSIDEADDYAIEDSLAYEHGFSDDDEEEEAGYLEQAAEQARSMTRGREGRVVVAALASGFAIGAAIGCLIAGSSQHKVTWSERLACEGLGRSMLDRLASVMPESITEKLHR